jgi:hypothetical protein
VWIAIFSKNINIYLYYRLIHKYTFKKTKPIDFRLQYTYLGSAMLRATSDDMECGMWNAGWYIDLKSKDRLYKSWNGSSGMEKRECSGIACWEGSHCIKWRKKMSRWMCMAKMLQWECDVEIPITMSRNTFKHIEIHWNIL